MRRLVQVVAVLVMMKMMAGGAGRIVNVQVARGVVAGAAAAAVRVVVVVAGEIAGARVRAIVNERRVEIVGRRRYSGGGRS